MRTPIFLLLLAALVAAQDEEEQYEETAVAEGVVATGIWMPRDVRITSLSRGETDGSATFVRIREGGVVQAKTGDAWKDVTLDQCSEFLTHARDTRALELRGKGEKPFDELPFGGKASTLRLSIEAQPTVPWRHVQWLLTLAVEEKYRKLELSDGTRRILALTGVDRSVDASPGWKPPIELLVPVKLVVREEPAGPGVDAKGILRVHIVVGDEKFAQAELAARLKKCKAIIDRERKDGPYKGAPSSVRIRAGAKVPFGDVLAALDACIDAGLPDVDMRFGGAIPPRVVRTAQRLPEPEGR